MALARTRGNAVTWTDKALTRKQIGGALPAVGMQLIRNVLRGLARAAASLTHKDEVATHLTSGNVPKIAKVMLCGLGSEVKTLMTQTQVLFFAKLKPSKLKTFYLIIYLFISSYVL